MPTSELKPILNLQLMDMIGMDFLGPIKPEGVGKNKYIPIIIDYSSRFLFAEVVKDADGATMVRILQKIAKLFGWPFAIYCDNASYFVKGKVPEDLKGYQVLQFSAPITYPSSVSLSERYVRLVLTGLRTVLAYEHKPLAHWDLYLDTVVFAINNRILRVHRFTPSQLFLGMSPKSWVEDVTVQDETVGTTLAGEQFNEKKFNEDVGEWHVWMTIAEREE